jgi:hypothetical protein
MRYFVTLLLTACMIGTWTTVNAYMFSEVRGLIVPTVGVLMRIWANVIFMVLVCIVIFITFMALQPARAQEEDSGKWQGDFPEMPNSKASPQGRDTCHSDPG